MNNLKQKLANEIRPILEKGKSINDIVFISKKMTMNDIALGLMFCRPTGGYPIKKRFSFFRTKEINMRYTGMADEPLNNMLCHPIFGGDYICQLIFGCIAALDVYTEEEILKVLTVQQKWSDHNEY